MTNKQRVLSVVTAATLLFIWIHSCMPPEVSSDESSWVMGIIEPILEIFVGRGNVTEFMVRKLAHFAEFFALGMELGLMVSSAMFPNVKKKYARFVVAFAAGLLAAFCDETIQIFSGRGDSIPDVWLDFSGVVSGVLVSYALVKPVLKKRKKQIKET